MDELYKVLSTSLYLNLGIVPIEPGCSAHDFERILAGLPPAEARKMKRKFRKLWRQFAKNPLKGTSSTYTEQLGLGKEKPTRKHRKMRKYEVSRRVSAEVRKNLQEIKEVTKREET